ncbi:MAG: hypothetical protein J2P58_06590 [Acidimicrobiaceae bacterium]|nr:hypothetical protein [Acidimicrobiaceae bacterium]MBO0747709.1 hypothetical protein [Acidimicrobiaceae bacterium]
MKKLLTLVGIGIGFILGSRVGRGPYEQIEGEVRKFAGRPEVHDRFESARTAATQQLSGLKSKATSKFPSSGNGAKPASEEASTSTESASSGEASSSGEGTGSEDVAHSE